MHMNVLLSLLIRAAIYIIIENISESIKSCVHKEDPVSHVISKMSDLLLTEKTLMDTNGIRE